jgi:hypothetical protein
MEEAAVVEKRAARLEVQSKARASSAERMRRYRATHGFKVEEMTLEDGRVVRQCPACAEEGRVVPGTNYPAGYKSREEFVEYRPGRWSHYCYDHNEKNKEEKRTKAEWDRDANNRAIRESMEKKRIADNLELLRRREAVQREKAKKAEKSG